MKLTVMLPVRAPSTPNLREHWAGRAGRAKEQRGVARMMVGSRFHTRDGLSFPMVVTLTRLSPRTLDGDNLQGALKAVRDGVADALGVDDRASCVTWRYAQEKAPAKKCGVRVELERDAPLD